MCTGGGSSSSSTSVYQYELEQEQLQESAAASAASLAEQQREFDISEQNRATDLASSTALQAQEQASADQSAALTEQWQTGRSAEAQGATQSINDAFAQFTPDYYQKYAEAYQQNYDPEVERQYGLAKQDLGYGLARQGITQSQSAATQQGLLAQEKGRQEADIANKAQDAAATLQSQVASSKQNLLNTALSDQTLGSPVTPGSADAITSAFNTTSAALSSIKQTAQDTQSALSATPSYSSLGNIFGQAASGVANYVSGNEYYNAYGAGSGSPSASSPTSGTSYSVKG
jgi:hypothetical protein